LRLADHAPSDVYARRLRLAAERGE
jgi:hypothetical protein